MALKVQISLGFGNQIFQSCFNPSLRLRSYEKTSLEIDGLRTLKSSQLSPLLLRPNDSCEIESRLD
jgi:hypothetical protein